MSLLSVSNAFEIRKVENNFASLVSPFFNACNRGGIMSLSTVFHYNFRSVFSSPSVGRYHSVSNSVVIVYVINCNVKRLYFQKEINAFASEIIFSFSRKKTKTYSFNLLPDRFKYKFPI